DGVQGLEFAFRVPPLGGKGGELVEFGLICVDAGAGGGGGLGRHGHQGARRRNEKGPRIARPFIVAVSASINGGYPRLQSQRGGSGHGLHASCWKRWAAVRPCLPCRCGWGRCRG